METRRQPLRELSALPPSDRGERRCRSRAQHPRASIWRGVKHSNTSSCASQSFRLLFGSRRCPGSSVSRLRRRCDRSQPASSGCARPLIGRDSSDVPQLQIKPWIGSVRHFRRGRVLCVRSKHCKLPRVVESSAVHVAFSGRPYLAA